MKLDPILLAPQKLPASMPTRRAFLGMGLTFAVGGAIGTACGYSMGASAASQPSGSAPEEDLKPSGDADLDELRRLAVKAPIEELVEKNLVFFMMLSRHYRKDPFLWKGVERLCSEVVANKSLQSRLIIAKQLVVAIEKNGPPPELRLERYLPDLRVASK